MALPEVEVALVQAALQEFVLFEVQERVVVAPTVIVEGLPVKFTDGSSGPPPCGLTITVLVVEALSPPESVTV